MAYSAIRAAEDLRPGLVTRSKRESFKIYSAINFRDLSTELIQSFLKHLELPVLRLKKFSAQKLSNHLKW